MPNAPATAVTLFADVCGSVRLYDRLGDSEALRRIEDSLAFLSGVVTDYQGTVVKTIGDELLCVFANPEQTVRAAVEMLGRLNAWPENQAEPIVFRIGLHAGEVLYRGSDVFGDAVNLAARIVSLSGNNQILTSAETVAQLSTELGRTCRLIGPVFVKGKQEAITLYEIPWSDSGEATLLGAPLTDRDFEQLRLVLKLGGTTHIVNSENPILRAGRADDNELVTAIPTASRHHLLIELRGDKFILSDQSTNGTYVFNTMDNSRQRLHREQIVLSGQGWISQGHNQPDPEQAIHYQFMDSA